MNAQIFAIICLRRRASVSLFLFSASIMLFSTIFNTRLKYFSWRWKDCRILKQELRRSSWPFVCILICGGLRAFKIEFFVRLLFKWWSIGHLIEANKSSINAMQHAMRCNVQWNATCKREQRPVYSSISQTWASSSTTNSPKTIGFMLCASRCKRRQSP